MNSRIIKILEAIRNGTTYEAEPLSRVERILKSFIDGSEYTETPLSRHEELLLAIKNGSTVDFSPCTKVEEILVAIANGTLDAWLVGKNLVDIYKSGITAPSDTSVEVKENLINISNASYYVGISAFGKEGNTYILNGDIETTSADENAKTWRLQYFDGTLSDAYGLNKSIVAAKNVKGIYVYVSWGTLANATIKNLKFEIGKIATPYTPYAFESDLEEAYYLTADKLKGGA